MQMLSVWRLPALCPYEDDLFYAHEVRFPEASTYDRLPGGGYRIAFVFRWLNPLQKRPFFAEEKMQHRQKLSGEQVPMPPDVERKIWLIRWGEDAAVLIQRIWRGYAVRDVPPPLIQLPCTNFDDKLGAVYLSLPGHPAFHWHGDVDRSFSEIRFCFPGDLNPLEMHSKSALDMHFRQVQEYFGQEVD